MAGIVAGDRRGSGGLPRRKVKQGSASGKISAGGLRRGQPIKPTSGAKTEPLKFAPGQGKPRRRPPVRGPKPGVGDPLKAREGYRKMVKAKNIRAGGRGF